MLEPAGYCVDSRSIEEYTFLSFFPEDSKDVICLFYVLTFLISSSHQYVKSREMKTLLGERGVIVLEQLITYLEHAKREPCISHHTLDGLKWNLKRKQYKTRKILETFIYFVQRKDLLNNV